MKEKDNQHSQERPRRRRPTRPVLMQDDERYRLLFGPYEPPIPKRGHLVDEVRGKVPFSHYSNALIPWPKARKQGKGGSGGFILCGDLLRALKTESGPAISHHWGVSRSTITNWRQALQMTTRKSRTPGAERLVRMGVELARLPESRKKIADAARGRTISTWHKKRFHGAMLEGWRERLKARRAAYRRTGRFPIATKSDPWLPEEERFLSKLPTGELVVLLGRSAGSIQNRRLQKGIRARAPVNQNVWEEKETQLLGTDLDRVIAKRLGRSIASVEGKRRKLGVPSVYDHLWAPEEEAIIGKVPDAEAARRLGRTLKAVQHHRRKMGMRFFESNARKWTPDEEALVGTDTDMVIAKRLGRTRVSVAMMRRHKGIPAKSNVRPWTPEEIAVLGTMSDGAAARKLKRTVLAVSCKRLDSGIEAGFNRRWTREEDKLLGTMSDAEVAAKLGRTTQAVHMRRAGLHIRQPEPTPEQMAKYQDFSPREIRQFVRHPDQRPPSAKRARVKIGKVIGREWTISEMQLLGTLTDTEAARQLRRSYDSVQLKRRKLGIPGVRLGALPWTEDDLSLLGKISDEEASRRLGRSLSAVKTQRQKRGISSTTPWLRPWTKEELRLIGKLPDAEVAELTGHSEYAAACKRREMGLPKLDPVHQPWTEAEDALLGRFSDEDVARRINRTAPAARRRRVLLGIGNQFSSRPAWTPDLDKLLGTATDEEIARQLGRTKAAVRTRRLKLGIPVKSLTRHHWTAEEEALLGTMPDKDLAEQIGATLSAVKSRRNEKGIKGRRHGSRHG